MTQVNIQDVGVGLRSEHFSLFSEGKADIPWVEVLTDNFIDTQGPALQKLKQVRENYPVVMHGVGMSLGAAEPLNMDYLRAVKNLINIVQPTSVSDHLCWTGLSGHNTHELLPLPFTRDAIKIVVAHIQQAQEYLGLPLLIENISSYFQFPNNEMSEAEFVAEVVRQSGCGLLLDVNNVYVNAHNHGFNALHYFDSLDPHSIKQFHLGGFEKDAKLLIDTHGASVHEAVWHLYAIALQKFGQHPTCIEWDNNVPKWPALIEEVKKAQEVRHHVSATEMVS